jgi:hypothetical protein
MKCIYFSKGQCYASPTQKLPELFTPDEEDKKDFCENKNFRACPRFLTLHPTPAADGGKS